MSKDTGAVKPSSRKDSGPVSAEVRNGKVTMKLPIYMILSFLGLLGLGGGGFLGIQTVAPDPTVVNSTAAEVGGLREDVGHIKTELAKLNVLLSAMADDRNDLQRQLDAQQEAIDELRDTVPRAREVDELRRRIERLEAKDK